ncbi:MAG TPA: zinc ABC transporter substrate-binding protein [Solirubrobacterales bacterium]|nr:zinc ABC transporter substrate-binding protein [Solirubrobacterales bacterium]
MRAILNLPNAATLAALVATAVGVLGFAGCGDGGGGSASSGVEVAATTTEVADLAANVAGDRADVEGILAPNSDPHEYEPRPSDAEAVADADLILQSGGDLDLWLDQIVESAGTEAPVVTLIDSVQTIAGEGEGGEPEVDPHWWQDPTNAIAAVEQIRDSLIEVDPDGAGEYRENAKTYVSRLERLDSRIEACIERIPADQRKLVTSHDALGYLANRYDMEVIGAAIPALTTQAQASSGETADLVDLIRTEGVKAVFPEAGVSQQLEDAIANETGAEIGGVLWADALGPPDSSGATYIDSMAANAATMVDGLTGGAQSCEIDVGSG